MGNRDLLEVLYLESVGDRDPTPTRWYRFDSRDPGNGEARKRRRAWLLLGLFAAAVMTAVALGPKMPPLGTPGLNASAGRAQEAPPLRPTLYDLCRTMTWPVWVTGCASGGDMSDPY